MKIILSLALVGLLPFLGSTIEGQACVKPVVSSSPPPVVRLVTNGRSSVTIWVENAWVERIAASGSMRPAIHDGSRVIFVPPDLRLMSEGRAILFRHPGQPGQRVLHRIYAEGVDSSVPREMLGTGSSGWTLAWDAQWYAPGITPPSSPLETRYWLTWGDNNCLPDFWAVRYGDVLGVMVGVVE